MTEELGILESVDLREVWPDEAQDFTPWLSEDDNLAKLGDTLGLELELVGTEQEVGRFSADIVCRNLSDDSRSLVLIENQIAPTNHTHLGQNLTYAAGLDAVTVVWIASEFKDEHRAAVDWLNELTDDRLSLFALEIELWQIDGSRPAPKFNIVSRPNDWTAQIARSTQRPPSSNDEQNERFWIRLAEDLNSSNRLPKPRKPSIRTFTTFNIGGRGFELRASTSRQKKQIQVSLIMRTEHSLAHFKLLEEQKGTIEEKIGGEFEWRERPAGKECVISCNNTSFDPANENDWDDQIRWTREKIHAFYDVFQKMIPELDPADWSPEIVEADEEILAAAS